MEFKGASEYFFTNQGPTIGSYELVNYIVYDAEELLDHPNLYTPGSIFAVMSGESSGIWLVDEESALGYIKPLPTVRFRAIIPDHTSNPTQVWVGDPSSGEWVDYTPRPLLIEPFEWPSAAKAGYDLVLAILSIADDGVIAPISGLEDWEFIFASTVSNPENPDLLYRFSFYSMPIGLSFEDIELDSDSAIFASLYVFDRFNPVVDDFLDDYPYRDWVSQLGGFRYNSFVDEGLLYGGVVDTHNDIDAYKHFDAVFVFMATVSLRTPLLEEELPYAPFGISMYDDYGFTEGLNISIPKSRYGSILGSGVGMAMAASHDPVDIGEQIPGPIWRLSAGVGGVVASQWLVVKFAIGGAGSGWYIDVLQI